MAEGMLKTAEGRLANLAGLGIIDAESAAEANMADEYSQAREQMTRANEALSAAYNAYFGSPAGGGGTGAVDAPSAKQG